MSRRLKDVPTCIVRELENQGIPENCVLFHKRGIGWVYRQCDSDLIHQLSQATADSSEMSAFSAQEQTDRQLEHLGPFGIQETNISLSIIQESGMYTVNLNERLDALANCPEIEDVGQHAPIAPVTLNGVARDAANIPRSATHFCWVYPPAGFTQLSEKRKATINRKLARGDPDYTFLALGGFAYFRFDKYSVKTLQINCLVKADNGLHFDGPYSWQSEYTKHLSKEGRFQDVTISELIDVGIKYYCFINPNERLKSSRRNGVVWTPAPNGGFVYLYDSKQMPHKYDCYFTVVDTQMISQKNAPVMPFSIILSQQNSSSSNSNRRPWSEQHSATKSSPLVTYEAANQFKCSICFAQTVRCLFIPCKHMCTCADCANRIREQLHSVCPICRKRFTEVWDIFL
ncbi:unnamed protein product [Rotaria magnacalcarata]|uniref:RING-type domain-containing protein n=1 Tax=Rotaria magnacalcarata TaxID=392030 RepID=A0A814Q9T7_9BILA|nr:unnamed protein product [Rotaria magnacalcarata]CAF4880289.1 unnamed protein product [Rotaria magnacalcarata]